MRHAEWPPHWKVDARSFQESLAESVIAPLADGASSTSVQSCNSESLESHCTCAFPETNHHCTSSDPPCSSMEADHAMVTVKSEGGDLGVEDCPADCSCSSEEVRCRICFCSEEDDETGVIIRPCACADGE
jgi:hypothetical protein